MISSLIQALSSYMQGDAAVILPEMELLLFAVGILVIDSWMHAREKYWNASMAIAAVAFSGYTLWILRNRVAAQGELIGFHDAVIADPFFLFFAALFLAATLLVILLSAGCSEIEEAQEAKYYALLLFACIGMMLMISGVELIVILLGIEIMALSFYALTGFPQREERSMRAVLRFMLLGGFSTGVLAYGFSLLYGVSSSTNIGRIGNMLDRRAHISLLQGVTDWFAVLAFVTIAVGLFFKIAAAPFHRWAPDVHQDTPTSVSAYLYVTAMAAGCALLLRLFTVLFGASHGPWMYPLAGVALVSLTWGNFAALAQTNLKRLLAYSSISHAGYILLGLVAGNETALTGIVNYLFGYVFMTTGAIAVIMVLNQRGLIAEELADLDGLWQRSPGAALLLLVFMLSLAGIPPTAGFMSKYFIFKSLFEAKRPALAAIAALYIIVGFYNYSRVVVHAWRKPAAPAARPVFGSAQTVVLTITAFATLVAGLYPEPFLRLARYAFGQ